jgi:predicted O-methyltransferase YrrM
MTLFDRIYIYEEFTDARYRMCDRASMEFEAAMMLTALAGYIKPDIVLETGTARGVSTLAISNGMASGTIHTCDVQIDIHLFDTTDHRAKIEFHQQDVFAFLQEHSTDKAGLIFLDDAHELEHVSRELEFITTHRDILAPEGLVVVHDTNNPGCPGTREAVERWATLFRIIDFPFARGLTIMRLK